MREGSEMAKTLYIVSCVKTKLPHAAPARDLYCSHWFRLARRYAETRADSTDSWLILSAKYGVVEPSQVVEPYEESLKFLGRSARRRWADTVVTNLLQRTQPGDTLVRLAGERYREYLLGPLSDAGRNVEVPMRGFTQGFQTSWLASQLSAAGIEPIEDDSAEAPVETGASSFRLEHLRQFYTLLDRLRDGVGGYRKLAESSGRMGWPERGVYFFFEDGEERSSSGSGPRVVRVGTHAVGNVEGQSFWTRLRSHRGNEDGGRHRTSVFRRLIGSSLAQQNPALAVASWGVKNNADRQTLEQEGPLEKLVSQVLGSMPLLWLDVYDAPSKDSLRSYIERNSIALLSNSGKSPLDAPSADWLGHDCPRPRVRSSGLWNQNHTEEAYDPQFLDVLRDLIEAQISGGSSIEIGRPERKASSEPPARSISSRRPYTTKNRYGERPSVLQPSTEIQSALYVASAPRRSRPLRPGSTRRCPPALASWRYTKSSKNCLRIVDTLRACVVRRKTRN